MLSRLHEREPESRAIVDALDEVVAGRGHVVVVEGPAGIGKTSLLELAGDAARERNVAVAGARGSELESAYAWGVTRQLFEPRLRGMSADTRSRTLAGAAALAGPVVLPDASSAARRRRVVRRAPRSVLAGRRAGGASGRSCSSSTTCTGPTALRSGSWSSSRTGSTPCPRWCWRRSGRPPLGEGAPRGAAGRRRSSSRRCRWMRLPRCSPSATAPGVCGVRRGVPRRHRRQSAADQAAGRGTALERGRRRRAAR